MKWDEGWVKPGWGVVPLAWGAVSVGCGALIERNTVNIFSIWGKS